jgi:hypothetical protein
VCILCVLITSVYHNARFKKLSSSGILDCVIGVIVPDISKVFSSVVGHFGITDEGTTIVRSLNYLGVANSTVLPTRRLESLSVNFKVTARLYNLTLSSYMEFNEKCALGDGCFFLLQVKCGK